MLTKEELWTGINEQIDWFAGLYSRWLDECEYEDINEYHEVIKERLPDAYAMSKRPFGFKVHTTDGDMHIQFRLKGSNIETSMVCL